MFRPTVARTIPLLALLLAPLAATAETRATWDLLTAIDGKADLPAGVSALYRGAHGETRAALRVPLPGTLSVPLEVPPRAVLALGFAFQAAAFMTETPELAEPGRVRVSFTEGGDDADAGETVLLERKIDIRANPADRRWFDERIDLAKLAGKRGTLTLEALNDGDAEKAKGTNVYFSAPRVLQAGDAESAAGMAGDAKSAAGMNVLLITIDCLRADHVGAYGYDKPTTPNLDRLAREGVRFANAFANAPMTLPSIPQLFTSTLFPTKDVHTVLEPVARAGIPSAAVVNNAWIPLWLSQGKHAEPPGTFDAMISGDLDAKAVTDRALAWLAAHSDDRFFLYLHYLDAHTPYAPPEQFIETFADPAYRGKVGDTFADAEGADAGRYDAADKKKIVALYDAAVRYVDQQIGRVLEFLARSGDLDRTAVLVTADHGEEFWDHGRFFHGQSLYDELLHVPLLVRGPEGATPGKVVERQVRLLDVAPSLVGWAGLERPETFEGRSLDEAIAAPDAPPDALIATATQAQFPTRYAVRTGELKLIESLDTGTRELFDVQADRAEKTNLAGERPAERSALQARLDAAREILRRRGYQVRVVGPQSGEAAVELTLTSEPRSGTFLTLDRTSAGGSPRLSMSKDGNVLSAKLDVDARGGGFRFDRLLSPRNIAKDDKLALALKVGGTPVSRSAIALGPSGAAPSRDVVDIADASLTSTTEPACAAPPAGVRVCLWRYPGEKLAEMPEISDPAVRERLRALGYLQ
jgi:arylsulfatase A-like enzyme